VENSFRQVRRGIGRETGKGKGLRKEEEEEEEQQPSKEMGTVRGSLNLQDSVENSFREKLVIQVMKEGERLEREMG
jgi:hypothetical protein